MVEIFILGIQRLNWAILCRGTMLLLSGAAAANGTTWPPGALMARSLWLTHPLCAAPPLVRHPRAVAFAVCPLSFAKPHRDPKAFLRVFAGVLGFIFAPPYTAHRKFSELCAPLFWTLENFHFLLSASKEGESK